MRPFHVVVLAAALVWSGVLAMNLATKPSLPPGEPAVIDWGIPAVKWVP